MKVLHVIYHLGQGGAQTYLYNLILRQIADQSLNPSLLVLNERGSLSDQFDELGIPVAHMGMRNGYDVLGGYRVWRALSAAQADIIHSHSNNIIFNLCLQLVKRPVLYTEHGGELLGGRQRDKLIYRLLHRPIRRFVAISEEMARVMARVNPAIKTKVSVVYNGVDVHAIDSALPPAPETLPGDVEEATFRVGIIGRLVEQKGVDYYLAVAGEIAKRCPGAVFLVVGDGPLESGLRQQASALGIADQVFFLGFRLDAISVLKRFDVFLFTSRYEPFGLVITEAMAAGVPVVCAHREGAVPEIVEDGESGVVIPGYAPVEFAKRVVQLLGDSEQCQYLSRNARARVEQRFTIERNAAHIRGIYDKCLDGH